MLLRWYRRCILRSSLDGGIVLDQPWSQDGGSFMGPSYGPTDTVPDYAHTIWEYYMDRIVGAHIKGLDGMPHHFQMHVIHAIEIVGYKHPDKRIGAWWNKVYNRLVHDFHLWPEEEEQLDARLGDSREGWLARTDSATVA